VSPFIAISSVLPIFPEALSVLNNSNVALVMPIL